jgi:hypothetical protein
MGMTAKVEVIFSRTNLKKMFLQKSTNLSFQKDDEGTNTTDALMRSVLHVNFCLPLVRKL